MVDKSISMTKDEVLELDYLVSKETNDSVTFRDKPNEVSDSYLSRKSYVFDPQGTGTYKFDINGSTIEVDVINIPTTVIDNFESNSNGGIYSSEDDLSTYYRGDLGPFSRSTTNAAEGSLSLFSDSPETSSITVLYSLRGDGLPYYPKKGSVISTLQINHGNSTDGDNAPGIIFGVGENTNGIDGYAVKSDERDNSFSISKITDGSFQTIASSSPSLSNETWYEIEVEWHDGSGSESDNTIVASIYETSTNPPSRGTKIDTISTTDSKFASNRGVGHIVGAAGQSVGNVPVTDNLKVLGSVQ